MNSRARKSKMNTLRTRDGDNCWYCGSRLDFDLPRTHLEAPTFEHVIPASEGGTNENSNLKLTHKVCNGIRGRFFEGKGYKVAA